MKRYNKNKTLYLLVLSFIMLIPSVLRAQTPGGTGLATEVWLSADKVNGAGGALPGNEASIETWSSVLPGGRSYVKNNGTAANNLVPTFVRTGNNLMNFQPHLNFSQTTTKLINSTSLLDLTKAYYVFHVSRTASTAAYRVLFAFSTNNGTERDNNIGWSSGRPYMELDGDNLFHQGNGKLYGVSASIMPNKTGAGSVAPTSYMNGVANTTAHTLEAFNQATHNMSVIGNADNEAADPFTGDLQELIIISGTNNTTIDAANLNKINSYLAIKYGITLESGNYVNSSNTTVWDRSRVGYTNYNNNIFGLANDEASGLLQKQARSTDGKELTIFVGDELADLNANNTSNALNNGDYLLLGSNANKKLVTYTHAQGTSFLEGGSLDRDIDVRNGLTFRAQATRGFSDVKIVSDADYVLISNNDESFAPGNTRIYKVNDQGYASVRIDDGDFISFAFYRGAPGGIGANLELWLAADRLSGGSPLENEDEVSTWDDISGNGRYFVKNGANAVPKFSESGLNYHPAVNFSDEESETAAVNNARKLVSAEAFPVSRANSYYAFYVSQLDSLSGYSTVFSFNYGRNDNLGWNAAGNLWLDTQGNNINAAVDKIYGIGTAIIPNTTGTGRVLYHDGVAAPLPATQMYNYTANREAVIGNSTLTDDEAFYGDIQEIIIYSGTQGQVMDATEMTKVHTYLAVKYGIDLQSNYISSTNDIVWDRSKNNGYTKNVFGLANDHGSGLHIKQSVSTEAGDIIAFVGDKLADLNADNTGSIPAGQYMMLGSTGGGEMKSYRQHPDDNPPYQGQALDDEVNFISGTVLKAQLTGTSSFTFKLIGPGSFIVVSQDPDFDPASTRLYKKDANNEGTEITVNDGDYIGFIFYATGPGGIISGLRMWLDADNLNTLTLNAQGQVMAWRDKSNISNTIYTFDAVKGSFSYTYPPTYTKSSIYTNFYPAVSFFSNSNSTTVGDHIEYLGTHRGPSSVANPDAYTYINVVYTGESLTQRSYFLSFGGFDWGTDSRHPVFGMIGESSGVKGRYFESGGLQRTGTVTLFKVGATSLNYVDVKKRTSVTFESNGIKDVLSATNVGASSATKLNGQGMLGAGSLRYASLKGVVGQSIFYEKTLTDLEKNKINTYLALKYASTVRPNGTATFNYVLSDESSIWNGNEAPYSNYYNNIAAIVSDKASDLRNNIARSTDAGAMITIGLRKHDLKMSGQGDTSLLLDEADCSAIIWGNDGADLNSVDKFRPFSTTELEKVCNAATQRTVRSWMIRKTNNLGAQEVTMYLRNGDFGSFVSSGYQPTLFIADSPEKIASNDFDRMIPGSYDKDLQAHVIHFTIYSEFTYFALGVKMLPGACETCDFEGGKTISFNRNGWANGTTTNNFNLGDDGTGEGNFTVDIDTKFETSTSSFYRGYPRASSQSTLRFRRRGATAPLMTTTIIPSASAAASFHIFNLDRESRRYKEVEIYGECVNPSDGTTSTVYPDLKYTATGRRPRSSYQIIGNTGQAQRTPTSGYTANTGKMKVTFEYPVEKIFIKQHAPGTRTGAQDIGLGPITFTCPQPLPTFTEQGLSMTKQATDTVKLCGTSTVDYVFRVYNANCDRNIISISDTLPENMYWVEDLISIEESAMNHEKFAITISDDKRSLQIDSLIIPGAAFPFTFSAKAMFTDAAGEGIYENQAWLRTTILVEDIPVVPAPYPSADYYRGEGMKSKTVAIDGGVRFEPVTVSVTKSKDCYAPTNEITVTLSINNPTANNQAITDMFLDFGYNEEFEYVNNSVTSTIAGLAPNPQFDMDGLVPYPGYFFFEGFTLPTGTSTISFKVKAPIKENLVGEVDDQDRPLDWDGNVLTPPFDPDEQAKVELIMSYDFSTEMNDDCISTTLDRANGDIIIPYCQSKECIITNRMLQPRLR